MNKSNDSRLVYIVAGVMFVLGCIALVWAFGLPEDDILTEQNLYCAMVFEDTYPDYKQTFEKSCAQWLTEHDKSVN